MSALNLHVTVPPERELSRGGGEEWEAAAEGGGVQYRWDTREQGAARLHKLMDFAE